MRNVIREKVAREIAEWRHQGLVDSTTGELLDQRYALGATAGQVALRWLAFFGVFMLGSSVLGLIGMAMGSAAEFLAPLVVAAISAAAWLKGAKLAADPLQRYPLSGQALLSSGLLGAFGTLALFHGIYLDGGFEKAFPMMMMMVAAGAIMTAYHFGLRWPLVLGILLFFHGLGNWHAYGGSGAYFMGIRDERLTLAAGLAVVALGRWHEDEFETHADRPWVGFGSSYVVWGLLYINLSAWFLSLMGRDLSMVLLFTAVTITQIVLGARWHDSRLIGFGVVFLSINLYTRFFEHFWDRMSQGTFFLIAGIAAVVLGIVFERQVRQPAGSAEPGLRAETEPKVEHGPEDRS